MNELMQPVVTGETPSLVHNAMCKHAFVLRLTPRTSDNMDVHA